MFTQNFTRAKAVTPHDTNTIDPKFTAKALYVGAEGDVAVETPKGDLVTFLAVPAGTTILLACRRVLDTGTDADNIVVLGD